MIPLLSEAKDAAPKWTADSPVKSGNQYTVVCYAEGPGIDSARTLAIGDCKRSAAEMKSNDTSIKTLIVETERSASLHQETVAKGIAKNVVCEPKKEFSAEGEGFVKIWVQCLFDLEKIKTDSNDAEENQSDQPLVTQKMSVTIGSTPRCQSILVVSKFPSVVKCESNPVQVVIDGTTTDVIIRADGYRPYHLGKEILKTGVKDAYNVFLSK
jgi:hypothetical protein